MGIVKETMHLTLTMNVKIERNQLDRKNYITNKNSTKKQRKIGINKNKILRKEWNWTQEKNLSNKHKH